MENAGPRSDPPRRVSVACRDSSSCSQPPLSASSLAARSSHPPPPPRRTPLSQGAGHFCVYVSRSFLCQKSQGSFPCQLFACFKGRPVVSHLIESPAAVTHIERAGKEIVESVDLWRDAAGYKPGLDRAASKCRRFGPPCLSRNAQSIHMIKAISAWP